MLVTVYITTYNRREFLDRAINSVLDQTYSPIQIIVADDGSTDGSQEYLAALQNDDVVTAILNTSGKSRGACYGRNRAIELAQGEFITGLDDDDYFEPWRVETFLNKWHEFSASKKQFSALFDSVVEHRKSGKVACYDTKVVTYEGLRKGNLVGNQVFTRTSDLRAIEGFDEEMPALQDWDTWLRLSKYKGDILNINSRSYIQIQDHGSDRITGKPGSKIRFAFTRLMSKLEPLSFSEESHLLSTMYGGYPQVDIRPSELFKIFLGGHFRKVAQVIKRTLLK
ncbi:glycosyltransferase [Alteromonas sp. A081]|uniref:glycosyltransferase n=1 Tax=Alteromonas sp. A081 TaxID=3410269 RepID=UPI003B97D71C